jgi:hypothetical protein
MNGYDDRLEKEGVLHDNRSLGGKPWVRGWQRAPYLMFAPPKAFTSAETETLLSVKKAASESAVGCAK